VQPKIDTNFKNAKALVFGKTLTRSEWHFR